MLTSSLIAAENKKCTCNTYELSTTEKVVFYGAIGTGVVAGTVIAAPYVLPAATIAAIKASAAAAATSAASAATSAASAAATQIVPTTVVGKVGLGLTAAQLARPYVLKTTEEKLEALLKEKALKPTTAKTEFVNCLKANKNSQRNALGRPVVCEEAALFYAFNSSVSELNKRTQAFKNGKCFCS